MEKIRYFPLQIFILTLLLICILILILPANPQTSGNRHEILHRSIEQTVPANDRLNVNLYEGPQSNLQVLTYEHLAGISNDHLLLINSNYAVPGNISGELVRVINYVRTLYIDLLMAKDALVMLQEMFNSAAGAGYNLFRAGDGYRTHERQRSLYDSAADKSFVSLPGYSEHQTGLAVDISYQGISIENSRQGTWLMNNSYKFGFILRYPQNKTHITGIPFEPWHYRFIGLPHAYFCYINNLALEEYIYYLKIHRGIKISFNNIDYNIHYLSDNRETIEIPENYTYTASLDNTGGIIVTTWIE